VPQKLLVWAGRAAVALLLLVVFTFTAYWSFNFWVHRGVTRVPELVGRSETAAREALTANGLRLRRADAGRFSATIAQGDVVETRPAAGAYVKRGAEIEAVLSLGTQRIELQDLTGKAIAAARLTLEGEGLALGPLLSVISARGPAGTIVGQDPRAGTELAAGAPVTLLVALDRSPVAWVMPDLVSRRYEPVRARLQAAGFHFGNVRFETYAGVAAGTILSQDPLPGHPLRREQSISLVVASAGSGAGS